MLRGMSASGIEVELRALEIVDVEEAQGEALDTLKLLMAYLCHELEAKRDFELFQAVTLRFLTVLCTKVNCTVLYCTVLCRTVPLAALLLCSCCALLSAFLPSRIRVPQKNLSWLSLSEEFGASTVQTWIVHMFSVPGASACAGAAGAW